MIQLYYMAKREFANLIINPAVIFATAFFVMLNSFAMYVAVTATNTPLAIIDDAAIFMTFTSIFLMPIITMRAFAEEEARGTMEVLITSPIKTGTIVLAKIIGAYVYSLIFLANLIVYAILLSMAGNLDWNVVAVAVAILALFFLMEICVGVWVSALTTSTTAAAAGTIAVLLVMLFLAEFESGNSWVDRLLYCTSYLTYIKKAVRGVLETRAIIYFVSISAMLVFFTKLALKFRDKSKGKKNNTERKKIIVSKILIASAAIAALIQVAIINIFSLENDLINAWKNNENFNIKWLIPTAIMILLIIAAAINYQINRKKNNQNININNKQKNNKNNAEGKKEYYRKIVMWISITATLIIVININWLANYPFKIFANKKYLFALEYLQGKSWDMSEDKKNSLQENTKKILDKLQAKVKAYAFFAAEENYHGVDINSNLSELLEKYVRYNGYIDANIVDVKKNPDKLLELAIELDIPINKLYSTILLEYQGRRITVSANNLIRPPSWQEELAGEKKWYFEGEKSITRAIDLIINPRITRVFFTSGKLEMSVSPGVRPDRSIARFAENLTKLNMQVKILPPRIEEKIPEECDILIVAAPRVQMNENEAREINEYIEKGGKIMVLAPVADKEIVWENDNLNKILYEMGGAIRDDQVQDPKNNENGQAVLPLGKFKEYNESQINFVFTNARSIKENPQAEENGWEVDRLIESYKTAVAINGEGKKINIKKGPFTMAIRASKKIENSEKNEARMVLIAAGQMAADSDILREANEAILNSLVQWLANREDKNESIEKIEIDRKINVSQVMVKTMLWIDIIALPLIWVAIGVIVIGMRKE